MRGPPSKPRRCTCLANYRDGIWGQRPAPLPRQTQGRRTLRFLPMMISKTPSTLSDMELPSATIAARTRRPFTPVQQQRRTFLGLQRPPPPKSPMMGYLVAQGLAIVLLADLAIATAQGETTTIRSVCQSAGFWTEGPDFTVAHGKDSSKPL